MLKYLCMQSLYIYLSFLILHCILLLLSVLMNTAPSFNDVVAPGLIKHVT